MVTPRPVVKFNSMIIVYTSGEDQKREPAEVGLPMKFIWNEGISDPRLNLALEEYALRAFREDETYVLFYVNDPAIIIGRNQHTIGGIDPGVVSRRGIRLVRRVSGGGAVYHDAGNLNFSVITRYAPEHFNQYERFTQPIVTALNQLGIPAELSGRNDLQVEGRKVSGNAQFSTGGRMLSHGTLLVASDLGVLGSALRPKPGKVESKGARSVRARVANISDFLPESLRVDDVRRLVLAEMFRDSLPGSTRRLDAREWREVRQLAERKYGSWEWTYGESPPCNLTRARRYPSGEVEARMQLEGGRIGEVRISGDFFGRMPVRELELRLAGTRYDRNAILDALAEFPVSAAIEGLDTEEFADLIAG